MPDVRRLLTLLFSRCLLLKTCSAGTNRCRMCFRFFVLLDVIVLSAWRAYFAVMAQVISQLFAGSALRDGRRGRREDYYFGCGG